METIADRLEKLTEKVRLPPKMSRAETLNFFEGSQEGENRFQESLSKLTPEIVAEPSFAKAHQRLARAQDGFMAALEQKLKL